ncbi:hypothetical protein [Clostridium tertium]|uniref:hypothetical protein n=1 Tax=Clostridium tertium TaxID=1559 RepID=UPI003DA413F9
MGRTEEIVSGATLNRHLKHLKRLNSNIINTIPLFTEGQTRRFIEDKTNTDTILGLSDCKEYVVALIKNDDDLYKMIDTKETNLLQAYWKVACMIAKEAVDE